MAGHPCYANSQLVIERDLAVFPDWTPEAVRKRRAAIVKWALERWRVDDAPKAVPDAEDRD